MLIRTQWGHAAFYEDRDIRRDYERYNYYLSILYEEYKNIIIPKKDINEKNVEEFVNCLIKK